MKNKEGRKNPNFKHGDAKVHYLHRLWRNIKNRCLNTKGEKYKYWGGRGITIYSEWINNYPLFKEYILDYLGERPNGYTIDRINNNGNYEPNNLRWANRSLQNTNQRPKKLTKDDVKSIRYISSHTNMSCPEIGRLYNVSAATINRINNNLIHKL